MKYVATIYFECNDDTDYRKAVDVAADRMEQYGTINVEDTHVEEAPLDETLEQT